MRVGDSVIASIRCATLLAVATCFSATAQAAAIGAQADAPAQQAALTKEFRTMMIRTYLSALTLYKNAQINIKGTRAGDDITEQTVRTEVTLPSQRPIPLDFSFERNGADWKVYDITVEGISFINNHRNQFGAEIRKDGIDGLIKSLVERNNPTRQSK